MKHTRLKRWFFTGLMAMLFVQPLAGVSHSAEFELVDRIVAIVNDRLITYSKLEEAFKPFEQKIREKNYPIDKEMEIRFKIRSNLIQQLIDQEITDQEVERAQITVSDAEIDNYIERIKQINSFTDENLRQMLQNEGVTLDQYKKEVRNIILRNKIINYEIKSRIVITRSEIEEYYKKHKDEYGQKTIKDVSTVIEDKLYQNAVEERFRKWVADLSAQAQIKIIQ
jgi:peptidyl-prolyl cis-trans isomerase SurA